MHTYLLPGSTVSPEEETTRHDAKDPLSPPALLVYMNQAAVGFIFLDNDIIRDEGLYIFHLLCPRLFSNATVFEAANRLATLILGYNSLYIILCIESTDSTD